MVTQPDSTEPRLGGVTLQGRSLPRGHLYGDLACEQLQRSQVKDKKPCWLIQLTAYFAPQAVLLLAKVLMGETGAYGIWMLSVSIT